MREYRPQSKVVSEEQKTIKVKPCGCRVVEIVDFDEDGELLAGRLEDYPCLSHGYDNTPPFEQIIDTMAYHARYDEE